MNKDRNLELLGLKENAQLKSLKSEQFQQVDKSYQKEILSECTCDKNNDRVEEFEQKKFESRPEDKDLYDLRKTAAPAEVESLDEAEKKKLVAQKVKRILKEFEDMLKEV